ncbi:DUF6402 family protein [Variovorax sp. OV329]|uniref:DUF6402 family protein n=1 Tax=Variovorax sp. OV329 TaxID=1882825 RepID=UPI0008EE945E|nr:DUF6402 family protein [Variovorax sp. OV329]SFN10803.1 hypothetical protein SAMN05444747_11558 [Variovorax sp. OV329]
MSQEQDATTWRAGTGLLPFWEANHACRCEIEGLALSMGKPPPTLAFPPAPPPPPPPAPVQLTRAQKQAAKDEKFFNNVVAVVDGVSAFRAWLKQPPAPKAPSVAAASPPPAPAVQVKPVDIQDIPATMRKLNMPVSAAMMERWFKGQLNYSPTEADEKEGLNQNGQPYPPSMIDKSIITMDWALKYKRARIAFENLTEQSYYTKDRWTGRMEPSPQLYTHSALRTQSAYIELRKALLPYWQRHGFMHTWQLCNGDIEELHRDFQFQFLQVDGSLSQKIAEQLRVNLTNQGIPDDLTGALGAFNLYAAVSRFYIERTAASVVAVVTGIALYVKDSYTFTTNHARPSQYLGHWNRRSVVISPYTSIASEFIEADYPLVVDKKPVRPATFLEDMIYHPVRNRSFRDWQMKHQQGGDFIAYSDFRWVTLVTPIRVVL